MCPVFHRGGDQVLLPVPNTNLRKMYRWGVENCNLVKRSVYRKKRRRKSVSMTQISTFGTYAMDLFRRSDMEPTSKKSTNLAQCTSPRTSASNLRNSLSPQVAFREQSLHQAHDFFSIKFET